MFQIFMLIGQKLRNICDSIVVSLVGVHTTAVDFKTKWRIVLGVKMLLLTLFLMKAWSYQVQCRMFRYTGRNSDYS